MQNEDGYVFEPHHFGKIKVIPWSVCIKCGHVDFTNGFSMWVRSVGCDSRWHPDMKKMRVKLVRQHQKERGIT